MIDFVITMAGHGHRFKKEGYKIPKYMVKVHGKTLFEYSMEGLPLEIANKLVFICLAEHEDLYSVKKFITAKVSHPNIEVILLNKVTRGQAETACKAENIITYNNEILIYNIDTYFTSTTLKKHLIDNKNKNVGFLGAFIDESDDDKWSFAKINQGGNVIETAEKNKISNYALTGLYHFKNSDDFFSIARKWIKDGKTVKNEFYIAPMYNDLILTGKHFKLDIVDKFIPLGTPQEVKYFEKNT